jgi:hypothetical protein
MPRINNPCIDNLCRRITPDAERFRDSVNVIRAMHCNGRSKSLGLSHCTNQLMDRRAVWRVIDRLAILTSFSRGASQNMKVKAYAVSAFAAAFIALTLVSAPAGAQAPAKSLKDRMEGGWHLVSVVVGEAQPYGSNPTGLMYIGADGDFSVIAVGEGTSQKIGYLGTYTVDDPEASITFHVLATTAAMGAGRDHKWQVTFSGDEMIQNMASPTGNKGPVTLVWKRGN